MVCDEDGAGGISSSNHDAEFSIRIRKIITTRKRSQITFVEKKKRVNPYKPLGENSHHKSLLTHPLKYFARWDPPR